ncbi:STAS domain-containing protein [Streptomyces sp. NPDC056470]|uniref:STAS domain-containing protein n=1 Tax=unclassified Streptomyces TaxID=2593676 RepID=UPI0036C1B062
MKPDRTPPGTQRVSPNCNPAWQDATGHAFVRYAPTGSPATAVLHLSGEFDADTVGCLHEALDSVRSWRAERLLLDLTEVEFADVAFVHELSDAHDRPGRLVLVGPLTSPVRRILALTGTRARFHIVLDQDTGV